MTGFRTTLFLGIAAAAVSGCGSSTLTGGAPSSSGSESTTESTSGGGTTGTSGSPSGSGGASGSSSGSRSGSGSVASGSSASDSSTSSKSGSSSSSSSTTTQPPPGDGGAVGPSGLPPGPMNNVPKPSGAVGGLKVLNWAGFTAAVSYNFDDSNSSQISNYAALEAEGVHYTFYAWGSRISGSLAAWQQAVKDGHEMGNHTQDHNDATLTAGNGQSDVDQCDTTLKSSLGVTAYTFAEPNGTAGWETPAMMHHFISRGVSDGLMMPGDETTTPPNNIHCYIPPTGAQTSAFNSEVTGAVNGGGWRVILVHGFTGGSDGAFQPVDIGQYTAGVTFAKSMTNLWIDTMVNVGAYWRGQNAFNKATTTPAGNNTTTYKWTLPANFPPGKFLRVSVTGGTVSQNGAALTWNSHGYYEVSLDVGSLTVGP